MEDNSTSARKNIARMGFHYYQDTVHYSDKDLSRWMPELESLGTAWLVIQSEPDRAIPEAFLQGLIQAGIEPIIQFQVALPNPPEQSSLKLVLESYANWGVRYIQMFDRPNLTSSWSSAAWFQEDLVERFLDRFLPLAETICSLGMTPVFPALEPGGNYWDTAFLKSALESMERRKQTEISRKMALSAYAYTFSKPLDWGAGGPERWGDVRPYFTPDGSEDQLGFRIADWYSAIAKTVLGQDLPIFLFGVGLQANPMAPQGETFTPEIYSSFILEIASSFADQNSQKQYHPGDTILPINPAVTAACFWLLASEVESRFKAFAWYDEQGGSWPVVPALKEFALQNSLPAEPKSMPTPNPGEQQLEHYLLLPTYEWGVADWHLDVIRPFVKKYQPTIGFSLKDASLARQVTVIGNTQVFAESDLEMLRRSGCRVERINGDGTSIATQLAER
jgi:hypothetical protein